MTDLLIAAAPESSCDEDQERLIRVKASRRDETVYLRVHYGKSLALGCTTFQILAVENVE